LAQAWRVPSFPDAVFAPCHSQCQGWQAVCVAMPKQTASGNSVCGAPMKGRIVGQQMHSLEKTKLCKYFFNGRCMHGVKCNFAHGSEELQTQPNLFKTELCTDFMQSGACRFGGTCRFAHGFVELRTSGSHANDGVAGRAVIPLTEQLLSRHQHQAGFPGAVPGAHTHMHGIVPPPGLTEDFAATPLQNRRAVKVLCAVKKSLSRRSTDDESVDDDEGASGSSSRAGSAADTASTIDLATFPVKLSPPPYSLSNGLYASVPFEPTMPAYVKLPRSRLRPRRV